MAKLKEYKILFYILYTLNSSYLFNCNMENILNIYFVTYAVTQQLNLMSMVIYKYNY